MIQTSISQTELILSLLKADMKNYKLILGLQNAGVLADDFFTDLSKSILILIGFEERDDELYQVYENFMDTLLDIEVGEFHDSLHQLSLELYAKLLAEKKLREKVVRSKCFN